MIDIKIYSTPLSIKDCEAFVESPAAGGAVVFIGTVRNKTQSKTVLRLEFEAYEPMAIREMEKIAQEALSQFSISKIAIHHRIGVLDIGEIAVVIAVSAPHRGAAFDACEYCIDTLNRLFRYGKRRFLKMVMYG